MNKSIFKMYFIKVLPVIVIAFVLMFVSFFGRYSKMRKYADAYRYITENHIVNEEEISNIIYDKFKLNSYVFYYENGETTILDIESEFSSLYYDLESALTWSAFWLTLAAALKILINSRKTADFTACLPCKRHIHYIFQWLCVFLPCTVFYILYVIFMVYFNNYCQNALESFGIASTFDVNMAEFLRYWLITVFCSAAFMMLNKLFGNPVYCIINCFLFLFGLTGFLLGFTEFMEKILGRNISLYKIYGSFINSLNLQSNNKAIILLIIGTCICLILGVILNKFYPREKSGQIYAYNPVKYLVYIVGGIMGGFSFYKFLSEFSNINLTIPVSILTIIFGIFITVFSVSKIINLTENGGDSNEITAFNKARI